MVDEPDLDRTIERSRAIQARTSEAADQTAEITACAAELAEATWRTPGARAAQLQKEVQALREAMESRATIEQAKGIVMATVGRDPDEAFRLLVQQSQHQNRKLRAIAAEIVADAARANVSGR